VYRKLERSEGPVYGMELEETFTEEDMEAIESDLDEIIAEHGEVRLLARFDEGVPRPELEAIVEDLAYGFDHIDDVERYAVVSEGTLTEWVAKAEDAVFDADIRQFDPDEEERAWEWVEE